MAGVAYPLFPNGAAPPPPPPPVQQNGYGVNVPPPPPQQAAPPPPPPQAGYAAAASQQPYSAYTQSYSQPYEPPRPVASTSYGQQQKPPAPPPPQGQYSSQLHSQSQGQTQAVGQAGSSRSEEERQRREKDKERARRAAAAGGSQPHSSSSGAHRSSQGQGHVRSSQHGKPGSSSSSQHHAKAAAGNGHAKPGAVQQAAGKQQQVQQAPENRLRRETPFLAHIRFRNDLPEIPSDPKMLVSRVAPEELAQFQLTSLEEKPRRDLVLPPHIHISPLDAERWRAGEGEQEHDPADEALLRDADALLMGSGAAASGSGRPGRSFGARSKAIGLDGVSWLMRTTYISNDTVMVHKQGMSEKAAVQALEAGKRAAAIDPDVQAVSDRDTQMAVILESFEAAKKVPKHHRNPNLKPMEIMPVLPDFVSWPHKYVIAHFDGDDPIEDLAKAAHAAEHVDQGQEPPPLADSKLLVGHLMLKGFTVTEKGAAETTRIMALLTPRDPRPAAAAARRQAALRERVTADPQAHISDDEVVVADASSLAGEYEWAKEYKYELNKDKPHFFLRLGNGRATYCEADTTLRLKRREEKNVRGRRGREGEDEDTGAGEFQRPSKIVLLERGAGLQELQAREARLQQRAMHTPGELRAALAAAESAEAGDEGDD